MTELWFVEELVPGEVDEAPRKGHSTRSASTSRDDSIEVRADQPRWHVLSETEARSPLVDPESNIVLVRLGFQFAIPLRLHEKGYKVVWARCSSSVIGRGPLPPRVLDLFPKDLYDGSAREIQVNFTPKFKLGSLEASVGGVEGAVQVGRVQAVIVGYAGTDERAPYWEITPKSQDLIGTRNFWLLLEAPKGCSAIDLTVTVEAEVQHRLGRIPLGPREQSRDRRPRFEIPLIPHGGDLPPNA